MTLFRKLFVPVLGAAVFSLVATGVINYLAAREVIHSTRLLLGGSLARELTRGLSLVSSQLQQQMNAFAVSPEVIRLLDSQGKSGREEESRIKDHLTHAAQALESVRTLAVVDTEGRIAATSEPLGKGTQRGDRAYFQEAMRGKRAEQGPLIGRSSGQPVYVLAQPVAEDGRILGVIIGAVGLEYLNKTLVDPVRIDHEGYMFVLSASGQVIMHPDRSAVFMTDWFSPEQLEVMKKEKSGVLEYRLRETGTPMLASYVALPYPGWIVIATDTRENVLKRTASLRRSSLWVNGLMLLALLAFLSVMLLSMIRDLGKEVRFAEAVAGGDLDRRLDVRRKDEIGLLGRALSDMVGKLKEQLHVAARRSEEAERATAELSSLLNGIDGGVAKLRLDNPFSVLWANDGFYQLYGCSRNAFENCVGKRPGRAFHPDDLNLFLSAMREGARTGYPVHLTYRIIKPDGTLAWLSGKAILIGADSGQPVFQIVLIDITEQKQATHAVEMERNRYRILTRLSKDTLFEYDILSDTMVYSGRDEPLFGPGPVVERFLEKLDDRDVLHPDDRPMVRELLHGRPTQSPEAGIEVRVRQAGGRHVWYRGHFAALFDENRHPVKIIGSLTDIQLQKEKEERLRIRAQMDGLTGLLNKTTVENEIREALREQPEARHALLIVDVDDFKLANDHFGHQFGDEVLKEVARLLRQTFRMSDVLGRIGGDEFLVLAREIRDEASITGRIARFYKDVREIVVAGNPAYTLSVSMGICLYRGDDLDYAELFRRADAALYQAKKGGKGIFVRHDLSE